MLNVENVINDQVTEVFHQLTTSAEDNCEIQTIEMQSVDPVVTEIHEDTNTNSFSDNTNASMQTASINNEQTSCIDDSSSDFFYDFQAENFHAEQVKFILLID